MITNPKVEKTISQIQEQTDYSRYKLKIVPNMKQEYLDSVFDDRYTVYVRPGSYSMSTRKLHSLIDLAEIQRYYQCNPVRFISDWFNIELLDAQAYIVQRSWTCPNVLLVCSRG